MSKSKKIISQQEVQKIADLARLGLSSQETAKMTKDLEAVLSHFSKIQQIDTSNVSAAADASGLFNIVANDEAQAEKHGTHQQLLDNAPATKDGQIKVKAIFDN